MSVKLLSEQHLEFLRLKGGCTDLSESTLVKMPHCWKSHVAAHFPFSLATTVPIQTYLVAPLPIQTDIAATIPLMFNLLFNSHAYQTLECSTSGKKNCSMKKINNRGMPCNSLTQTNSIKAYLFDKMCGKKLFKISPFICATLQTVRIQISQLLKKLADQDLHCFNSPG